MDICAKLNTLSDLRELEETAKSLTAADLLLLCDYLQSLPQPPLWKIAALLLGLPSPVFVQFLMDASDTQLHLLTHETLKHATHHQLTLLLQRIQTEPERLISAIEEAERKMSRLTPGEMSVSEIQ